MVSDRSPPFMSKLPLNDTCKENKRKREVPFPQKPHSFANSWHCLRGTFAWRILPVLYQTGTQSIVTLCISFDTEFILMLWLSKRVLQHIPCFSRLDRVAARPGRSKCRGCPDHWKRVTWPSVFLRIVEIRVNLSFTDDWSFLGNVS